ncbi:DUF2850 domain-containing protein [Vibrio sp. S4M6]|uniref:DUF2850 domain-containing protein n=1 Tax=Vibrio sinus TaxID=2946865 RepID=UPI002029C0D1|nr:DUF2850 domain-containing protein [Vibrio sinus]MCL9780110.1 DUF2850 domain-containing protein [Vibrio sinus]
MTKSETRKAILFSVLAVLTVSFSTLVYVSYQDYVDPKHVYGDWIEIGAPSYDTDIITLNETGVYKNSRLVTTEFEFDGSEISIKTGGGETVYIIAGSFDSPQLKRVVPATPSKRLIKKGYEKTVQMDGGIGGAKARRAALSDHFSGRK